MGNKSKLESIIPIQWTFDEGLRASCEAFSIAIPDGYRVIESQDDDSNGVDISLSAVPKTHEDGDTTFRIAIRFMESKLSELYEESGIDELLIAMLRKVLNDGDNMFIPNSPEHWVAQGKNCSALITRTVTKVFGLFTQNGYLIRPISNDMRFRIDISMDEMDDEIAAAMHEPIEALISSIEITKPIESKLTKRLNKISTQKVELEEFSETVDRLVTVAALCKQEENTANQLEYVRNCENPNSYELARAVVLGMEEFLDRIFPVLASVFDAIEFQKSLGASQEELAGFAEAAKPILGLCITACNAEDQQSAQFLDEHGPVAFPEGFWNAVNYIDTYIPGTRIEMEEKVKAADDAFQAAIEKHINESPQVDQEPDGVDYPTLVMTLLSDDWIFFEDNEISWDGHHHAMAGAQLNGAKVDGLLDFVNSCIPGFDDVKEIFQYFASILNEVEKDEGLIIPREMIAPGVQKAIREGDLTGLTLANLAACGKALCVQKAKARSYRVIFDSRLIMGIPSFLDLVARLVWDLRQCTNSMRGKPFEISFLQARNIDADQYLDNVNTPVPGAQEYTMVVEVTEPPIVTLPGEGDAVEYQQQAAIDLSPDDDMALSFVDALVRDFPRTNSISGTHHLGRAKRIEHVKIGDKLILAADWDCPFFDPAGIEVFNAEGETLGFLEGAIGPERGALALILPFITATVESVTPVSQRRKGSKYALMDVHMELDENATVEGIWNVDPSNELLAVARRIISRPKSERKVMSHADIDISQLKGHIDVSSLPKVDSPKSHVPHQDSHLDQAEQAKKQKDREASRAEYERSKEEQREEEARAAKIARIEKIKSAIEGYDAELQSHEEKIKDAADAAYRAIVRDLDRPNRREALYKRYTAELMRDLELTEFNRFIKAQEQEDLASEEIAPLLRDKNLMAEGPLLDEATSFIEGHTRYLEKIEEGRKSDKSSMFNNPYHGRILEHLIEVGGDLSPEEISKDLFATMGLYWNPPEESENDPIDVDALLRYMQFPALEMSKALVDLDGNRLMTSDSPLWDSYNKSQTIISYKRMETNEDRCGLWFLFPLDKVSHLHYRRMLMDESHGAQAEIERLEGEIKRKEGLLEPPEKLDPLQAEGLREDISDYREKIEKYQQLAREAAIRERDYLEYRALFYVEDQATVIPRDAGVDKTAFLATRPVARPRKPKPPQAKNASSGARPSTNSTVTATSNASADASSADSGCLIPTIAAVIGFVVGCMNGGPFMGILLAAFTTGSAVMTINALKN